MGTALVFPGQGSQAIGMGQDLADTFPSARLVFEEVDDALSQKLSALMWLGPEEDLRLTANTQPALMAHSMAVVRVLEEETGFDLGEQSMMVAGHSLGEYSALCAAGAIGLADTARLLRIRGNAMQAAVPPGEGGMAALIGVDLETAQKAIDATPGEGVLQIANDNAPGQVVVSGAKAMVEDLVANAKKYGAKMAKSLPVSAPFHCELMAPAAERMSEALSSAEVKPPKVPVTANVTAEPVTSPDEIRRLLVEQVTGRVRWTESVNAMAAAGVTRFVEVGTGKVLTGLIKRISKGAELINLEKPADIEAFAKS